MSERIKVRRRTGGLDTVAEPASYSKAWAIAHRNGRVDVSTVSSTKGAVTNYPMLPGEKAVRVLVVPIYRSKL